MWTAGEDGALQLVADVVDGTTVELQATAMLGGKRFSWVQGPYSVEGGRVTVQVDAPPEAFLDDAALDYVTALRTRLLVSRDGELVASVPAPAAFLAWPLGPLFAPVVWDRATQELEAPNGVVSALVRGEMTDLEPGAWVQPDLGTDGKRE